MNTKVEEPGKDNVHNNAFYAEEKLLRSEMQAMRDCDPLSARHWIVSHSCPASIIHKMDLCFVLFCFVSHVQEPTNKCW